MSELTHLQQEAVALIGPVFLVAVCQAIIRRVAGAKAKIAVTTALIVLILAVVAPWAKHNIDPEGEAIPQLLLFGVLSLFLGYIIDYFEVSGAIANRIERNPTTGDAYKRRRDNDNREWIEPMTDTAVAIEATTRSGVGCLLVFGIGLVILAAITSIQF